MEEKVVNENVYVNDSITETAKDGNDAEILKEYDNSYSMVTSSIPTVAMAFGLIFIRMASALIGSAGCTMLNWSGCMP